MKKIYQVLMLAAIGNLALTSCTDNLELKPTSVISNASFWKTEDDAKGGTYGMYVTLRAQASKNLFLWGEGRSETVGSGVQGLDGRERYYLNTLDPTTPGPEWQGMYTVIHQCNLLLKYVPNITFTSEAVKNDMLAQAYTMRAYVYFTMTKTWGDLPLVLEPTEGFTPESIQKERTASADIFKQIKADIDKAIQLFPANTIPTGRFVWSKPSANALKGDVYLWTGKRAGGGNADITTALAALNEVKTADVVLLDNYASIFDYANKGNRETLFSIRFQQNEVTDNDFAAMYFSAAYIPNDIDAATSAAIGVANGNNFWAPTALFRDQFTTDDQRRNATFTEIYTSASGTRKFYGALQSKFKGFINSGVRLYLNDYIVYRYADILLMIAEAKNALGQDPSEEMNQVRKRAYGTALPNHLFVNGTKDANDDAILKERLLELGLEGKRWWDLIRFGKAFEKVPSLQSRAGQNYLLLFPISSNTLSLENKVKQNPGYN
ncbi:SusD-like protein P38 [Dyadobacter sp. CECT 9275]|uniref:SusD-like protein P38 n=1 Tax=Dyadobacter helix TaxID=2822344 RepID=A0A916N8V3_9BACT|nr:RagB/SusD family nutrient uptake outer membrane protein [Dyadobacter sp. CECT 9275]CAG5018610.1 SusD-like protein P38 [Dyadobacter sp. CECT 9275]